MKTSHWFILASMIGAIALQLSGVQHWHEVVTPQFVGGLLAQIAALLAAMFNEKPSNASGNPTCSVSSIR